MDDVLILSKEDEKLVSDFLFRQMQACNAPKVNIVDPDAIEKLVNGHFADSEAMESVACNISGLTLDKPDSLKPTDRLRTTFNAQKYISEGVSGASLALGRIRGKGLYDLNKGDDRVFGVLAKIPLPSEAHDSDWESKHEYNVGVALNQMRPYCPNFSMVFGVMNCYESPDALCALEGRSKVILYEFIKGQPLWKWSENAQEADCFLVLLQLINALRVAHRELGFVHEDLHANNVLIRDLGSPVYVPFLYNNRTYFLKTRYIPVMIDYGRSRMVFKLDRADVERILGRTLKGHGEKVRIATAMASRVPYGNPWNNDLKFYQGKKMAGEWHGPHQRYISYDIVRVMSGFNRDKLFARYFKGLGWNPGNQPISLDDARRMEAQMKGLHEQILNDVSTAGYIVDSPDRLEKGIPGLVCTDFWRKRAEVEPWITQVPAACLTKDQSNLMIQSNPRDLALLIDSTNPEDYAKISALPVFTELRESNTRRQSKLFEEIKNLVAMFANPETNFLERYRSLGLSLNYFYELHRRIAAEGIARSMEGRTFSMSSMSSYAWLRQFFVNTYESIQFALKEGKIEDLQTEWGNLLNNLGPAFNNLPNYFPDITVDKDDIPELDVF